MSREREYEVKPRGEDPPSPVYEAINSDGSKLRFTGERLSSVSSEIPEKERWTVLELYLTDFDTWILQGIGQSRVKGERTRYWYVVSSDPMDFLNKIMSDKDASTLAKKLISSAFMYLRDCSDDYSE